jgi:hypothetical protein
VEGDAVDRHTGVLEQLQRLRVVAYLHAHFGQDAISVCLDQGKTLFAQELVRRYLPANECGRVRPCTFTRAGRHAC